MMADQQQPKTCGECRHYIMDSGELGECLCPLPTGVPSCMARTWVYVNEDRDCPCHEPKEADHAN